MSFSKSLQPRHRHLNKDVSQKGPLVPPLSQTPPRPPDDRSLGPNGIGPLWNFT